MNGIFAVYKPSGVSSASFLQDVQDVFTKSSVFEPHLEAAKNAVRFNLGTNKRMSKEKIEKKANQLKVKIGHGGTLDPLASGVLVVGVGSGTKKLSHYLLECEKTYEAKALFGISTTTGDSEGEIITQNAIDHITKEAINETAKKFIGDLKQTPPIFSSLKVNGKPLYEYAREGIPLPTAIKVREVKVKDFKIFEEDSLRTDHEFKKLESELDENGVPKEHGLANNPTLNDSPLYFSTQYLEEAQKNNLPTEVGNPRQLKENESLPEKLPLVHFIADVSSGTYIRSLISDFGRALESSAYMVELIRKKQSEWELGKNVFTIEDFTTRDEKVWGPVLEKVLELGGDINVAKAFEEATAKLKAKEVSDSVEVETTEADGSDVSKKRPISEVE
ncbi:pseudouridine synthase [Scheffersomyces amazonensis]|uniref:pseudouridine synthase n=1 Tax=Scheffersomyces amazonensis TaxID=1078765 RepID=UPI00315DED49